jgi:hypothetical protein
MVIGDQEGQRMVTLRHATARPGILLLSPVAGDLPTVIVLLRLMRLHALAFCVILTAGVAGAAQRAVRDPFRDIAAPPRDSVRIEIVPGRPAYFIGEAIALTYRVTNVGSAPFRISEGGDYRGTRPWRFRVTVHDEAGDPVPDPYFNLISFGGLMGTREIAPGQSVELRVLLQRYARFTRSGTYTVRVAHDLGWGQFERDDFREAGGTLVVNEPTPADADRILASDDERRRDPDRHRQYSSAALDYESLRHPAYLPGLLARREEGSRELIDGIGSIATADGTRALLDLLDDSRPDVATRAIQILSARLPEVTPASRPDGQHVFDADRAWWAEQAWRAEFAAPLRRRLRAWISTNPVPGQRNAAAYALQWVGDGEDFALLHSVLDRALEAGRGQPVPDPHPPPDHPFWNVQAYEMALWRLIERNVAPPPNEDPETPADVFVFLVTLAIRPDFRPAGWEEVIEAALQSDIAEIRHTAILRLPLPPPSNVVSLLPSLLRDPDAAIQRGACGAAGASGDVRLAAPLLRTLETTRDDEVRDAASRALLQLGARDRVAVFWTDQMNDRDSVERALYFLGECVIGRPPHSRPALLDEDLSQIPALRDRWHRFLTAHGGKLAAGGTFPPGDPDLPGELFPFGYAFSLPDGTSWP